MISLSSETSAAAAAGILLALALIFPQKTKSPPWQAETLYFGDFTRDFMAVKV
jgi:hypothetical protein